MEAKGDQTSKLQEDYEKLKQDEDIKNILDLIKVSELEDSNQIELIIGAINGSLDLNKTSKKIGEMVGLKTNTIKVGIQTAQNVFRGRNWGTISSTDPQIFEGDQHYKGLSHKQDRT